ncbi:hypothetical protein ACFL17_09755 [Pseudomonadota bacterium]
MLVPTAKHETTSPTPLGRDDTHYICYQIIPARRVDSDQAPGGRFRKDLQAFFQDQFNDCAADISGGVSFSGSAVEGMCLFDIVKPVELCNPTGKVAVVAPRVSTAVVDESIPNSSDSLTCYQVKRSIKVRSATAATLSGAQVNLRLDPQQLRHTKRQIRKGTQIYVTPSNSFPAPEQIDTFNWDKVCVPSTVVNSSRAEFWEDFEYDDSIENHDWLIDDGTPQTAMDPADSENRAAFVPGTLGDDQIFYRDVGEIPLHPGKQISLRFYDTGDYCECFMSVELRFDNKSNFITVGWGTDLERYVYFGGAQTSGIPDIHGFDPHNLRSVGWHEFLWKVNNNGSINMYIDGKLIKGGIKAPDGTPLTTLSEIVIGATFHFTQASEFFSLYVDDIVISE